MLRVHVLVEGQTEEEFVRDILYPYLQSKSIYLNPIIAKTRRAIGGNAAYRGGIVSYGKIEFDVKRLVNDTSVSLVTTMIDFYRLPTDFPGFGDKEAKRLSYDAVRYLESKFKDAVGHPKFFPYIAIHEFEALLFSEPETIVSEVRGQDANAQTALQTVAKKYKNPEEINRDDPPSKHILKHLTEYDKVLHGSLIAVEIGIEKMREKCPHFHEWLIELEKLAAT
jgi:hypothetical protein